MSPVVLLAFYLFISIIAISKQFVLTEIVSAWCGFKLVSSVSGNFGDLLQHKSVDRPFFCTVVPAVRVSLICAVVVVRSRNVRIDPRRFFHEPHPLGSLFLWNIHISWACTLRNLL